MTLASFSIAGSWPKITDFSSGSSRSSCSRAETETVFSGMRAIVATTRSISAVPISCLRRSAGRMLSAAPASSMTSIALSGNWRSLMCFAASSVAATSASSV